LVPIQVAEKECDMDDVLTICCILLLLIWIVRILKGENFN